MIIAGTVALASDQTMMCGRVLFALGLPLVYLLSCAWSFATAPTVTDSVLFPSGHTSLEQLLMPALQRESDEQNQTSLLLPTRSVTLRPFPPRPGRESKGFDIPQRNRMVLQDFISPLEAARLRQMGMSLYQGQTAKKETAFSFQVKYLGLSPQAAAQAVEAGSISAQDAQLYLTVIERIRRKVTEQFQLRTELYHHFTHIVCRSPNIEAPLVSEGAYLPAHADNCNLNVTSGQCQYSSQAFTWRHYTSLLYLHEDFEGGHFFFSHGTHNIRPEMWVRPRTGQLLTFTAGQENIHGVTHTVRGVRCILEQWFTIDPLYHDRIGPAQRSVTHKDGLL